MITKHRSFRDHAWTVFAFPKRNISLLWNETTKTYEFYKGIPHSKEKDLTPHEVKKIVRVKDGNIEYWQKVCLVLSGALGITITALLFVLLIKYI